MEYTLEINNLSKELANFKLNNISFKLQAGYIMGLIGPNGAGKTTIIKLIMNLLKKDSGQIRIFGKDHIEYEKEIKDRIGFVYDQSYFYENLSIEQMKKIIAPFYSKWDEEVFRQYIWDFNLNPGQKIKTLSKGMKMKFSLSLALSHHADFIIMDEPTSGLDPIVRRELLDILYEIIQDEKKAVFFSSHIVTDLEKIADHICFIDRGEMVFTKTINNIFDDYKLVRGGRDLLGYIDRGRLIGSRKSNIGMEALVKDREGLNKELLKDMIIEKPSLEDIMYYHIKGNKNV